MTTEYTYETRYQQVQAVVDPRGHATRFEYDDRGNLATRILPTVTVQEISEDGSGVPPLPAELRERFEYNAAGQLLRWTDARGVVVEYFYYPRAGKGDGGAQALTQEVGGYLARVVRDPETSDRRLEGQPVNLTTGFEYDEVGNLTAVLDGKANATSYSYDAHDRLVGVTSRQPFSYTTSFRYDANGNLVEGRLSFDHHQYDPSRQELIGTNTVARQAFEYNALNNVVRRTAASGEREITQTLVRDATENVVRDIEPMGNVVEYDFDERNRMVCRRFGAGTAEQVEVHHTYSANGKLQSTTDGRGGTEQYHYDGFDRYQGFTNAAGTRKQQWLDAAGNVTRIVVTGEMPSFDERGEPTETRELSLLESWFHCDELNRLVRVDRAWRDPLTGEPLGESRWDGRAGLVSDVVQYGANHLPARLWAESGNALSLRYDGANRLSGVGDATGETLSVEYDANSNPIRVERIGPPLDGEHRFRLVWQQEFDELDRLIGRSVNEGSTEQFVYNALNSVVEEQNPGGTRMRYLHDGFGRPTGWFARAVTPVATDDRPREQVVVERAEWDDNGRLVARVNARGYPIRYRYDALNRPSGIVHADGATYRVVRDAAGNVTRVVDPNSSVLTNRFDAVGRLVECSVEPAPGVRGRVERFHYDGLGRLVAAATEGAVTLRRYDSLSRLLEERQSGRPIRYAYDAAGSCVRLSYPGGREIERAFDSLGRLVEVREQGSVLARYHYGGGTQPRQQELGDVLTASFSYEPAAQRLSSLVYYAARDGEVVDGRAYRYDANGNPVQEASLRPGSAAGERYAYDSLDRLVAVHYGVEPLSAPERPFEREVLYELGPTGLWQRRTTRDPNKRVLERVEGVSGPREAYLSLGSRRFGYDANGNRIHEEDSQTDRSRKRYVYDQADRLVRLESLDADGQVVQSIDYDYDAFGRQVARRISRDGQTHESRRVWDGGQVVEEWEDGRPVTSFVYGTEVDEPLEMRVSRAAEPETYFYTLDGLGAVTGFVDGPGRFLQGSQLDIAGQPLHDGATGPLGENPILVRDQLWDSHARLFFTEAGAYDPSSMRFLSDSYQVVRSENDMGWGEFIETSGEVIETVGWLGVMLGGALIVAEGPGGLPLLGVGTLNIGLGKYLQEEGRKQRQQKKKGGSQDGTSSNQNNQNQNNQKKDDNSNRPNTQEMLSQAGRPDKDDAKREKHPRVTVEEIPDKGSKSMPNPEDGTGEGIDKDWWRELPFADALEVAEKLRTGPKVDEREGTVEFSLEAIDPERSLEHFLTPQPITVDEGGEGITINLSAIHSQSMSAGISTSDGWGDKPRTLAELLAAPRIRNMQAISRF